ncbi:MAG: rhomboid family intramembrane serine protease [Lachnospiraceae bacterium]|nr:rhomboid family intramembrane serine protease [Lachnospiraceae bacterium]
MTDKLEYRLYKGGYSKMSAEAETEGYTVYCDFMQSLVNTVVFIDARKYTHEAMRLFKERVSGNLASVGRNAHFLLILCVDANSPDYFEQMTVAKQVCSDNSFAWIYEEAFDELVVPEGQVEEFYGLRRIIEDKSVVPPVVDPSERTPVKADLGQRITSYIKSMPKATVVIVAINILVFILCTFKGDLLYNKGAVGLSLIQSPTEWYRIITSMFLHANLSHIFNNMLLLYFAGEITERAMGPRQFVAMYFFSGICGSFLTFASEIITGEAIVVIGASGAVFGVLGALLALVAYKRVRGATLQVPRIILVLALSIYSGFRETNVANWAHIGGLVAGLIYGIIYCIIKRAKGQRA